MTEKPQPDTTRSGAVRSLAQLVPKLTRRAIGKRGFAEAGLLSEWQAVVGQDIARKALPERLDFPRGKQREGTLHLSVAGAWATALQHLEPQLLERINSYFGYQAVARIKLHQTALPSSREEQRSPLRAEPAAAAREGGLTAAQAKALEEIENPALRAALDRLGRAWPAASAAKKQRG